MKKRSEKRPRFSMNSMCEDAVRATHFELPFLEARNVFLAGTFNNWAPCALPMKASSFGWATDLKLKPGTYEYLFVADGRWLADPNNPRSVANPFGGLNSVCEVIPCHACSERTASKTSKPESYEHNHRRSRKNK